MRYYRIGHEGQDNCEDRPKKRVMCVEAHPVSEHQCGVNRYPKRKRKLCIHIIAQCVNGQDSHSANSGRFISRQKAQIVIRKKKVAKTPKPPANILIPRVDIQEKGSLGPSVQEMDKSDD